MNVAYRHARRQIEFSKLAFEIFTIGIATTWWEYKIKISDAKERSRLRCNWRRMSILEFDKLAHYNALIIKATRNMTRYHGSFGSHFYNYIRLYCMDFSEQFSPYSTTSTEGPAKLRSKWLTISHDTTLLTSPGKIIHLAN